MGCLFALFAGIFPRLALFIVWVAKPALVAAAFNLDLSSARTVISIGR